MTISQRVRCLERAEPSYHPNAAVAEELSKKSLVLVVGPTSVGKSTLMNTIVQLDPRFARISGFTSREPRPDDEPALYRYVPHYYQNLVRICKQVENGELVQYAVHPTTGNIYATEIKDYKGQYNCKDVLGHAVAGFRALPCATSYTFGIVCDPAEWHARLHARFTNPDDPDRKKRLIEAKINLEWSLQDTNIIWIDNSNGQLANAAKAITDIVRDGKHPDPSAQITLRTKAEQMLTQL